MNIDLLKELSNADAVASKEQEVRSIFQRELSGICDEVSYDHLGSIIFRKKGTSKNPLKIMFCAHMDEVGFLVRHIADSGLVYLIALGGVLDKSKEMQMVRVSTKSGNKYEGILNVTRSDSGSVKEMYVDIGCESREEVENIGIEIGNMVTFSSESREIQPDIIAGKAMDDRSGCYAIIEAFKAMANRSIEHDIYVCATSSEEVGVRGGKTATYLVNPDLVFAIDVANHPELKRDFTNHRWIGKGIMLVHYDKTLAPNEKLVQYMLALLKEKTIPYQCDMFSGGGTDAGNAHLSRDGKLAMVLGIPLRYCHGAWSLVHCCDVQQMVNAIVETATSIDRDTYDEFINFERGK